MERFGEELRRERERRQVTLETICEITKVSVRHLEALESGRYNELPGGVFRKGIVRSYLRAAGLEEGDWLKRFEADLRSSGTVETEEEWAEFAENIRKNRGGLIGSRIDPRWIGIVVMIGALVVLGWGVWKYVLHGRLFLS
ncbi:helix-turn-helix domain-containing protein [Edaphobacter albus]|uniref:helix-turn-helix domain-containing protein n=1 Tax=Edaphobacter sp. 4G125 TaxID=2763071 RepID=UPI001646243D|nr:helix-turn-helix domain-containing protein [Edaphobacter sp. 4G125]QNI37775.1 helix-turn-helix domain-containing protein [Edaphobacter sp. 4G125]